MFGLNYQLRSFPFSDNRSDLMNSKMLMVEVVSLVEVDR